MKKQMIWSSMDMLDDEAREQYQELQREVQEDDTYTVSDAGVGGRGVRLPDR